MSVFSDSVQTHGENTKRSSGLSATETLTLQQPKSKARNILRLCGKPQFARNCEMTAGVAETILTLPKRQMQSADQCSGSLTLSGGSFGNVLQFITVVLIRAAISQLDVSVP